MKASGISKEAAEKMTSAELAKEKYPLTLGPVFMAEMLESGLLGCDHFTIDPSARLRTWLRPAERLALREFAAGDRVVVRGLVGSPELNGRTAVVGPYLPWRRRFACKVAGSGAAPIALRPANLEAARCGACGQCSARRGCFCSTLRPGAPLPPAFGNGRMPA